LGSEGKRRRADQKTNEVLKGMVQVMIKHGVSVGMRGDRDILLGRRKGDE
jgi:hypothetical protein